MAKIFLADTESYVEITQENANITLAEICYNFHVDPSSAYIRRAGSGAVVATLLTDTLPDISTTSEYILSANNNNNSNSGSNANASSSGRNMIMNEDGTTNSVENDQDAELQHAVLRMAQLVDSVTASSSSGAATSLLNATEEERQALESFFGKTKANANSQEGVQSRHQMFVTSDVKSTHYNPAALSQLLASLPRKNVNTEKYFFVDGY